MVTFIRFTTIVLASIASVGCAPLLSAPLADLAHARRHPAAVSRPAPPVVGRWDNVVALAPATPLTVIIADGSVRTGRFLTAGLRSMRLRVNGSEVDLPRDEILRVDVTPRAAGAVDGGDVVVGAARGAASVGGLMMAIPYLITGDVHVPPARFWGLGAVLGAADAVQKGRAENRERTVYVSRALVSGDW